MELPPEFVMESANFVIKVFVPIAILILQHCCITSQRIFVHNLTDTGYDGK
jgi:hypothetical protein